MTDHYVCANHLGDEVTLIAYYIGAKSQDVLFLDDELNLLAGHLEIDADPAEAVDLASAYGITEGAEYFVQVSDLSELDDLELALLKSWLDKHDALTSANQQILNDARDNDASLSM